MNVNNPNDVGLAVAAQEFKSFIIAALGAAVDLAETPIGVCGPAAGVAVGAVIINPGPGTLTASDTLFRTITVSKRTAGGSPVTIATGTTKTAASGGTGNWVAWTPVVIPTVAGATLAASDSVSVAITHASTGTAVPASVLEIFTGVN